MVTNSSYKTRPHKVPRRHCEDLVWKLQTQTAIPRIKLQQNTSFSAYIRIRTREKVTIQKSLKQTSCYFTLSPYHAVIFATMGKVDRIETKVIGSAARSEQVKIQNLRAAAKCGRGRYTEVRRPVTCIPDECNNNI